MILQAEQERIRLLLKETIPVLCKSGLSFQKEFCIEALVGITLDQKDVFLVNIKEIVKNDAGESSVELSIAKQTESDPKKNVQNLRIKLPRKRPKKPLNNEVGLDSEDTSNLQGT